MIQTTMPRLAEYFTVGEAADFLGVSPWTLRNWDKTGKLRPRRHPKNGYRIYRHQDLDAILKASDGPFVRTAPHEAPTDWSDIAESEHFVQFYETDAFLVESVSGFIGTALKAGDAAVVIATRAHRQGLESQLAARGIDLSAVCASGQFVMLDAAETLSEFMVDGSPDPERFTAVVGGVVARLTRSGRRVRAFGEMVALLWADGNQPAAIHLEELWNDLAKVHRFALFCAYPMNGVAGEANGESFGSVCTCHTRVIPAESYASLPNREQQLREIAALQQKARSLEAEIAHRRQVEQALSRRERELSDFFENATEGLHMVGPDGMILWANEAELTLLGFSKQEYIGRHIAEFHVDREVIDDMLARLQRGESLFNHPARLRHKDGSIRHVLVSSNSYFEDGRFVYTRCFTRDITDRKLAEEERARRAAEELEASKAEARRRAFFLNAISHDLRTPLNGLVLQASLARLSAEAGDPATLNETLNQIEASVVATSDLLHALLEAARDGVGESTPTSVLEVEDQLTHVQSACRASAEQKGLVLRVTAATGLRVRVDRIKLERILLNLVDNAIKFTDTGTVHVEAQQSGGDVKIHVVDTGVGIAPEHQARLFEEFYQVANAHRDRRQGFGLGLPVARRLARELGGDILIESAPGRGSRFTVSLPGVVVGDTTH